MTTSPNPFLANFDANEAARQADVANQRAALIATLEEQNPPPQTDTTETGGGETT